MRKKRVYSGIASAAAINSPPATVSSSFNASISCLREDVRVALGFAGMRPSSQEQPDQSTECELFKQQCRHHRKQHGTETIHGFEKQVHDCPSSARPSCADHNQSRTIRLRSGWRRFL